MHACTPARSVPCHLPLFRIDTQCICLALSPLLFPFPPSPFPSSHIYIRHGQDNRSDQGTSKTARQRLPPLSSAVRAYAIAGAEVVVNPSPQHVLASRPRLRRTSRPPGQGRERLLAGAAAPRLQASRRRPRRAVPPGLPAEAAPRLQAGAASASRPGLLRHASGPPGRGRTVPCLQASRLRPRSASRPRPRAPGPPLGWDRRTRHSSGRGRCARRASSQVGRPPVAPPPAAPDLEKIEMESGEIQRI
ncbi:hypothetical protein PVAP13_8KG165203 [Panicum virgatum]|uniref:Uncharacterized protein n=1 Tax=Panicum virgatum TaxID=38727 RepID=A0A8T0PGS8_PANVG|nr:hypothetical protein PVAP13_8KG165203 [Panicum virgatum]